MKGIILAAGLGTRLETKIPKPLTNITEEKSILDFQIESLKKKIDDKNIIIVVGYKKDLIMKRFPELNYVYNNAYEKTNTAKSLLVALKKIDDDVICMNGDIFFQEKVLDLMLEQELSCCLVDNKKCADEEVKYNLKNDGTINQLSKIIKDPLGEALGIFTFRKNDLETLRKELENVNDDDYQEKAYENLSHDNKLKMWPINIGKLFCHEIDFEDDLEIAKRFVSELKK